MLIAADGNIWHRSNDRHVDRARSPTRRLYRVAAIARGFRLSSAAGLFLAGCAWGFLPCAMVYAALFYAMLSGSWSAGAVVMLGFGLGTSPPVVAAGIGFPLLSRRATTGWLRIAVGVAIVAIGIATVLVPAATMPDWCRPG